MTASALPAGAEVPASSNFKAPSNIKTPTILPTKEVRSVLGLRGVQSATGDEWTAKPPTRTLQLLPPKPAPVPERDDLNETETAGKAKAAESTKAPPSSARMVTRGDATLRGFRKSWEPAGTQIADRVSPLSMRPVAPEPAAVPKQFDGPKRPAYAGAELGLPFPLAPPMIPAGNRNSYPAWISPNQDYTTGATTNGPSVTEPSESRDQSGWRPRGSYPRRITVAQPPRAPVATIPSVIAAPDAQPETTLAPIDRNLRGLANELLRIPTRQEAPEWVSLEPDHPIGSGVLDPNQPTTVTVDRAKPAEPTHPNQTPTALESLGSKTDSRVPRKSLAETIPPNDPVQPMEPQANQSPASKVNPESAVAEESPVAVAEPSEPAQTQTDDATDSIAEVMKQTQDRNEASAAKPEASPDQSASGKLLTPIKINSLRSDTVAAKRAEPMDSSSSLEPLDADVLFQDIDAASEPARSQAEASDERSLAAESVRRDATGRPKTYEGKTAAILSQTILRMQPAIVSVLQTNQRRREIADRRSNWGMMHAIMVYGADTRLTARGRDYSTIAWLAGNNVCRGARLMTTRNGELVVRQGTGLQGHQGQFLMSLALAGVPTEYPLYVGRQKFSVEDLVNVEAADCRDNAELTFTLIGLAHYLDTEATWTSSDGKAWDFDRLIDAELSQPIVGEACGGTHRLMGFAHALRKRRMEGRPIDGQWRRADDFLNEFVDYAYQLQNRDGSFSTNWFAGPEDNGDLDRKTQTTGHITEFLLTYLPDAELVDPRITRSVSFLTRALQRLKIEDSSVGFRAHALRALAMYHARVYGDPIRYETRSGQRSMATRNSSTKPRR